MPALRGKDYGKTKMKYPDYTETESGLQYKVTHYEVIVKYSFIFLFMLSLILFVFILLDKAAGSENGGRSLTKSGRYRCGKIVQFMDNKIIWEEIIYQICQVERLSLLVQSLMELYLSRFLILYFFLFQIKYFS